MKDNIITIEIDNNALIPDSYTKIISVLNLIEYGTLSVRKYSLLSDSMKEIDDNCNTYFNEFLGDTE